MILRARGTLENENYRENSIPENLVRQWDVLCQRPKVSHSARHNLKAILAYSLNSSNISDRDYNAMLDDIYRLVRYEIRKARAESRRNLDGKV